MAPVGRLRRLDPAWAEGEPNGESPTGERERAGRTANVLSGPTSEQRERVRRAAPAANPTSAASPSSRASGESHERSESVEPLQNFSRAPSCT